MPVTQAVVGDQLNFTVDEGSDRSLQFSPLDSSGNPLNLTGLVFEFVAEAVDGTQVVKILTTDSGNPMGTVIVDTVASTVTVSLTPTACAAIYVPRGGYVYWALWVSPGTTSQAIILNGQIVGNRTAQP